uniref:SH3 domain-containing protein n=1 Tax=Plectus sambesii TaxID=2011161 RepID=A0A914WW92_9BILA
MAPVNFAGYETANGDYSSRRVAVAFAFCGAPHRIGRVETESKCTVVVVIGLAEAVFDNVAEWPDELAFRRGDLLRVLDDRPGDGVADGWWLCADQRGRRGIVPANRLRMMHRFGLHENRVITPQRFGDVFLYNNGRFPPFDDDFTTSSRTIGGSSPFGLGDAFSSLSLIHGPERAFPLSPADRFSSLRRPADHQQQPPAVRDIPIRIEGAPGANRITSHRGSPPPPPQRKYFHLMTPTTTSSSSEDERHRMAAAAAANQSVNKGESTTTSKLALGGEDVSWRRPQLGTTTAPDDTTDSGVHLLHPSGASRDEQRGSVASSVSLSASERSSLSDPPDALSSALSQPAAAAASSSAASAYDVPSRLLHRPAPAQLSKPTLAPKPTDVRKNDSNGNTSVLLNVLEGLYDTPSRARSSASPARSPAAVTGLRPWTLFRPTPTNGGTSRNADDVAHSIYDVPKTVMLNTGAPIANGNANNANSSISAGGLSSSAAALPSPATTSTKPPAPPASNSVIDRLIASERKLDACAKKMTKYTAPQFWRQPHVLQQNLMEIRETATDVAVALDDFVDTTARITIDRDDDESNRLSQLLSPLRDSKALIVRLKRTLDSTGWTLAALSRPKIADGGNDALDQFVAVVKQIPNDCRQMVQWAQSNPAIVFIRADPASSSSGSERRSLKTLSADSAGLPAGSSRSSVEFAPTAVAPSLPPPLSATTNPAAGPHQPIVTPSVFQHNAEARVFEEDDLRSVASDHESLFDDYDFVDGHGHDPQSATTTTTTTTNGNHHAKTNGTSDKTAGAAMQNGGTEKRPTVALSDEDKHILSFYSPQIDDHTDCLSNAIEEFLTAVEEQQPPREFVQRSKLVILAAHKLVYIGDNVAQCVHAGQLSAEVRRAADRLCSVLKECVSLTKTAAEKYPAVTAVQAMVDSIVGVSHAAHDLKLLVRHSIR